MSYAEAVGSKAVTNTTHNYENWQNSYTLWT
jgi:hypothetical protein